MMTACQCTGEYVLLSRSPMRRLLSILSFAIAFATRAVAEPPVVPGALAMPPPVESGEAVATGAVRPGFHLEIMAAEPLVVDPVALAFDEAGRLYVAEMRDYSERRDERLGRIKRLEDTDGDGRGDRATVFARDLPWPTAVTCWDGGIFVLAAPELLYFKDMDGDGVADVHALIFTGFGNLTEKLNVQALPNSLQWGPDQRIHGALGGNASLVENFARFGSAKVELRGRDFSFDPRLMDLRAESGGGQFGLTFDDAGRKYVCANSRHLMQVMVDDRVAARTENYLLPAPAIDIAADGPQAEVFRRSADEPWRVMRTKWRVAGLAPGPIEGGGRASGYFTSASGVTVYRGDAWPAEYYGDVFIADPGSNLIHHKKLTGDLVRRGERAPGEEKREFVASTDNWFRPVAFANAPDGNLWFADIYRQVIEHPWSLPETMKSQLDLNAGNDRGRIYRIVAVGASTRPAPRLDRANTAELAATLEHANGWHRDTAARLLHERNDPAAAPLLARLTERSSNPAARMLALNVLAGLEAAEGSQLAKAMGDESPEVRANAVRLCARTEQLTAKVAALAADPSPLVRAEVAWALVTMSSAEKSAAIETLFDHADEPWLRHAALAAAGGAIEPALTELSQKNPQRTDEFRALLRDGMGNAVAVPSFGPVAERAKAVAKFQPALTLAGHAEKGRTTFEARCALCHRLRGNGHAVGPDLDAAAAAGREKLLGNILEPSRELTAGYPLGVAETTNGETFSGILLSETAAGLSLRLPGGGTRTIRRAELGQLERPPHSLMPDGLEAGLTPQDMADLLEFLSR
ncbi:MAG: PVC-type heme-binding CxxCH protein [Chthoniobacteraceae bacterium]